MKPATGEGVAAGTGASLQIGGRLFFPMNLLARTFRADAAQARIIAELGLDALDIAPGDAEDYLGYLARMNTRIQQTGRVAELVAHYIMPAGVTETTWTTAHAAETAAYLETVDDEPSRRLIWELAGELVFFSLRSNVARAMISQSSTAATPAEPATASANPAGAGSSSSNSGRGRRLSDRWPRTTGILRGWSRAGRSAKD